LTDFGLSKIQKEDGECKTMAGTNYYLSPEMVMNKAYGMECDLWSWGVLLYEFVIGCPPFIGSNNY
jgi:serine/threonine protein kinase